MEITDFINKKYKIIFESDNMYYIKMSELLMNEYLRMYNDKEIYLERVIALNKF